MINQRTQITPTRFLYPWYFQVHPSFYFVLISFHFKTVHTFTARFILGSYWKTQNLLEGSYGIQNQVREADLVCNSVPQKYKDTCNIYTPYINKSKAELSSSRETSVWGGDLAREVPSRGAALGGRVGS